MGLYATSVEVYPSKSFLHRQSGSGFELAGLAGEGHKFRRLEKKTKTAVKHAKRIAKESKPVLNKAARITNALVQEFGTDDQKKKAEKVARVHNVIAGAGAVAPLPAAKLRRLMNKK